MVSRLTRNEKIAGSTPALGNKCWKSFGFLVSWMSDFSLLAF